MAGIKLIPEENPLIEIGKEDVFDYKEHIVDKNKINSDLDKYLSGKFKKGLGIGVPEFDKYLLLKENQLCASCGRKGGGKTTITAINYLMWTIANKMICTVAYQENDDWHIKFNMISMLLGLTLNELKELHKNKDILYEKASKFIDKYYIFIDVESIKEATEVTKSLIDKGVDIHTLIIDPANSFLSGFSDTGNDRRDYQVTALEVLKFTKKVCSVHVSQHPIISVQRDNTRDVTSYDAENGVYLNKAHVTYSINRDKGTSMNRIVVDNERTLHLGGSENHPDNPIVMEWMPNGINLHIDGVIHRNVIQTLRRIFNPLDEVFAKPETDNEQTKKDLPFISPDDAFGDFDPEPRIEF